MRVLNESYEHLRFVIRHPLQRKSGCTYRCTQSSPVTADETRQYAKGDLLGKGGVMCF
jgi:hypothetical protein